MSHFISLSFLYKLFSLLIQEKETNNINESGNFFQIAIDYIEQNYSEPFLSLSIVASHVHVSTGYLSRKFNQKLKLTFSEYLLNIRMQKALHLLNTTELSIQDIAFRVGYTDPYYFTNVFRKLNSCSPSQHRKNIKGNN